MERREEEAGLVADTNILISALIRLTTKRKLSDLLDSSKSRMPKSILNFTKKFIRLQEKIIKMKFKITIERDEDDRFVAECLDLPGCLSEGETLEEVMEIINKAIIGCLKSRLKNAGEKLKIPSFDRKLDISIDLTGNSHAQASTSWRR